MLKLLMLNEIKIERRRTQDHPNCDTPENLSLTRAGFWNPLAIPSLARVSGRRYF